MTYQIINFHFHQTLASYAQVLHLPNWFERNILQKRSKIVTYSGNQSSWMDNATYDFAPYKLTSLLTEEFHKQDLAYFKKVVAPQLVEFTKGIIALFFKNNNQ